MLFLEPLELRPKGQPCYVRILVWACSPPSISHIKIRPSLPYFIHIFAFIIFALNSLIILFLIILLFFLSVSDVLNWFQASSIRMRLRNGCECQKWCQARSNHWLLFHRNHKRFVRIKPSNVIVFFFVKLSEFSNFNRVIANCWKHMNSPPLSSQTTFLRVQNRRQQIMTWL